MSLPQSATTEPVEIIEFSPALREAFRAINLDWIRKDFEVEEIDERVLSDPEEHILKEGGAIVFARDTQTGEILGTCGLMKHGDGTFELTKMAVIETARGRKIGQLLGEAIVQRARQMGLGRIMLETNSRAVPAITLYHKMGFVDVPIDTPSDYSRADVRMILDLSSSP